jgi:predicted amidophosphoribosyltransferase
LVSHFEPLGPIDRLIPVPLSARRLRQRGFNQALELARAVEEQLQLAVDSASLRRVRDGLPQVELDRVRRIHNMIGAFDCAPLGGQRIAIIDDVITTGATARAAVAALRAAGASRVYVLALARADAEPLDRSEV